jgi:hypothetical protein
MKLKRPLPPDDLTYPGDKFVAAPEVASWMRRAFIDADAKLLNEDHSHLRDAHVGVLWTNEPNVSKQRQVVGTAEMPFFRGNAWQKARQEFQLEQWFGSVPDFIITLFAPFAARADGISFCAVCEHELYHCAPSLDEFGYPRFRQSDGSPIFAIRGHDVEQFVGVTRRYGAGASGVASLVEAARKRPLIARAQIEAVCGTCSLNAA